MEVNKIRGSYRVIDDNGNYTRYTEEEYLALFGEEVTEEKQDNLPLDLCTFSPSNV